MSAQIETHFVDQFRSNIYHLAQQKMSRIRPCVRTETQTGKKSFFDQIGVTDVVEKTARHQKTPQIDTPHARRSVTTKDYGWSDQIDNEDKLKMLHDPTSPYAQAASSAFGRKIDAVLIKAATDKAWTGEDGLTPVGFDDAMRVGVQHGDSVDTALTVAKLRAAKKRLDQREQPNDNRTIVANAEQMDALLGETPVISTDYNTVRALVHGEINTFLGFKFVRTELTGVDGDGHDKVLFFQKQALLLSVGKDMTTEVDKLPEKWHATQVAAYMTIGATRMEETGVGYIQCKAAA